MDFLKSLINEAESETKKDKKVVFIETDPQEAFPNDTVAALEKSVNAAAKDLEQDWKSAIEVVDFAFEDLEVPKPQIFQKKRWGQYNTLIGYAVKNLQDSRGSKGNWKVSI